MTLEETRVQITVDGKTDVLENYILITPKGANIDMHANCVPSDYLVAMLMLHDTFVKEAKLLSDQDLYEMCVALGFDYDDVRQMVRGE